MLAKSQLTRSIIAAIAAIQLVFLSWLNPVWAADNYQVINSSSVQGGALNVPSGNTYVLNMNGGTVTLSGNLANSGTLYVVSTNPALASATISANNIYNYQGALLTTILPAGGLPGIVSPVMNLSLNLQAINSIVNQGVISSAGSLTAQAASIINSGTMMATIGTLNAYTQNLINSGVMQALQGNINVSNPWGNTLQINNAGGRILASNDVIVKTLGSLTDANNKAVSQGFVEVLGGTLQGKHLILNSPNGDVNVNADRLNGLVNIAGRTARVGAVEGDLQLGEVNLSGDPMFFSGGNLDLSGLFSAGSTFATYGHDFTALAGGNISASTAPSGATITAQSATAPGGQIYLNAGADFTVSGENFVINGPSLTGGNIAMSNVRFVTNNNSVTMLANAGRQNAGNIATGDILVCCQDGVLAKALNVNIVGPGHISLGNIVNVAGAINVVSLLNDITLANDSVLRSFAGNLALQAARDITFGSRDQLEATRGSISAIAGNNVNLGTGNAVSAFGTGGVSEGHVNISAGENVSSGGANTLSAVGGNLSMSADKGNINTGLGDTIQANKSAGSQGPSGGNVNVLSSQGSVNVAANNSLSAVGGNLLVRSSTGPTGSVVSGSNTNFRAFADNTGGGNVTLSAPTGDVNLGQANSVASVGGNALLSVHGNLLTGSNSQINAFQQNNAGGNVTATTDTGNMSLGADNAVNAVGGDVHLQAPNGSVQTGVGTSIRASAVNGTGGTITSQAASENIGGSNQITADKSITVSATESGISSGTNTTFQTGNGSINLAANSGSIALGNRTTMSAVGGDINVSSANDLVHTGDISTGSQSTLNAFQQNGTGGNFSLNSPKGNVVIGSANTVNSVGGDATITGRGVTVQPATIINAFRQNDKGGTVAIDATNGNVQLQESNALNAQGGNIAINSATGSVSTGSNSAINAFSAGNAQGGNVAMIGQGNVTVGPANAINAVGGDVKLWSKGAEVSVGSQSKVVATLPANGSTGNVTVDSSAPLDMRDSVLQAANSVNVTSRNGDVSLTREFIYAGDESAGGSIIIASNGSGDILLTEGNRLRAFGGVRLTSSRDLVLGSSNTSGNAICAQNGSVELIASRSFQGGLGDTIRSQNGGITILAISGNIQLGISQLIAAGGGDLTLTSLSGDVNVGSHNVLNAFYQLSLPSAGGNIFINASNGTIYLGAFNRLNAVGGNIVLNSQNIDLGTDNRLCTFQPQTTGAGQVALVYNTDTTIEDTSLTIRGDLSISAPGLTLRNDKFLVVGGDLALTNTSTLQNRELFIDEGNLLEAYSTAWLPDYVGPITGGNVYLTSASDIRMSNEEGIGGPSLPDETPTNYVQAVNGNIVLNAFEKRIDILMDNVFVASKALPNGGVSNSGGGVYMFTDSAQMSPLPLPGSLNIFFFDDKKVNIDPSPSSFSSQGPTSATIHQISESGGDVTEVTATNGGTVNFNAGNSLIHVLSSDFIADNGIVYFKTGGPSSSYEIQFKDSAISAGNIVVPPPPPVCQPPARPVCPPPPAVQPPMPPAVPSVPPLPSVVTPPAQPQFPNPSAPTVCPPVPQPPTPPTPVPPQAALATPSSSIAALPPAEVSIPITLQPLVVNETYIANEFFAYYFVDVKESYLQATSGTKLNIASRKRVEMKDGTLIVRSGRDTVTVSCPEATIDVKPSDIVAVQAKDGQPTTITALAAAGGSSILVNSGGVTYRLKAGEMLLITDEPSQLPKLIAQAGASTEQPVTTTRQGNVYVMRASVSLPEYLPKIVFLHNRECALRNYLYNQVASTRGLAMEPRTALLNKNQLRATSSQTPAINPNPAEAITSEQSVVRYTSSVRLTQITEGHYSLSRGTILVHAVHPLRFDTPQGSAYIKTGAVALVSASPDMMRVRDLSDSWNGDIFVVVGKTCYALVPGREVNIVHTEGDPLPYVLSDGISRRDLKFSDVESFKIVNADFSIMHALLSNPLLRQSCNSTVPLERQLMAETLKSAAALNLVIDRVKGPYYVPANGSSNTGIVVKQSIEPVY